MKFYPFTLFLLITVYISSQELTGSIKNSNGEIMPFASVYLKKERVGTTSDIDGNFRIKLSNSLSRLDTLVISYIGYNTIKKQLYYGKTNKHLEVVLTPSVELIGDVEITSLKKYPPEYIINKALKKRKLNYINNYTLSSGFYREIMKEDTSFIGLNEAIIQLKYSGYPQANFISKAFKSYYKLDEMPRMYFAYTIFRHMLRFPSYIPINKDQIKIMASRQSTDFSVYGESTSPVGGPGDLIALDKVKYAYDFLDPKLIDEYEYKVVGQKNHKGVKCYVIDFKPKKSYNKKVFQPINKKMKFPIYLGRIYIEGGTFTIVSFDFQLANSVDFSIYNGHNNNIPDNITASVEYKKDEVGWILDKVKTNQIKYKKKNEINVCYKCTRELYLGKPKYVKSEFKDSIAYITKSLKLQTYSNHYNNQIWKSFEKNKLYKPISNKIKSHLELKTSLEEQFSNVNLPLDSLIPPLAKQELNYTTHLGDTLFDSYQWMSTKGNPEGISYIKEENKYFENVMFKLKKNSKLFYLHFNNLLKPSVSSSINTDRTFYIDKQKCIIEQDSIGAVCFYKIKQDSIRVLQINISKIQKGKKNFFLEEISFSSQGNLAYSYSTKGGYTKTLTVKGKESNLIKNNINNFLWYNDSILLYTKQDSSLRSNELYSLNVKNGLTKMLYHEENQSRILDIVVSDSKMYYFLVSSAIKQTEYMLVNDDLSIRPIIKVEGNEHYLFNHFGGDYLYGLKTSFTGRNEIIRINLSTNEIKTIYSTSEIIEDFVVTQNYIAFKEFKYNSNKLKYLQLKNRKIKEYKFDENYFSFDFKHQLLSKDTINIEFESFISPYYNYKIDLSSLEKVIVEEINTTKSLLDYETKLEFIKTESGIEIPITLFYDKEINKDSIKGIILKSYGAYGYRTSTIFDKESLVYLKNGFIVAFAHVRGGGEGGVYWHNSGSLLLKKNTFEDYVACAKHLKSKYNIKTENFIGIGSSAGGLIMGYVANNYPELFGTLVFDHPFLDVVSTMLDRKLALTTVEYEEWGNPYDTLVYKYIKSYSPYQNIKPHNYPNMIFFSGYYDVQTPYWQVAKSVARYRECNTSNSLILFYTDLKAGHKGSVNEVQNTLNKAAKYALIFSSIERSIN